MISTLGKNPEREKVIDFTIAYSPFFQAIFGPKSLAVKTPADLAGKTIGVTRGAMEDQEVDQDRPARPRRQALRGHERHGLGVRRRARCS